MSFTNHPADSISQSVFNTIVEAMNKTPAATGKITKGAFVIPNAGPHKGMRHKVTNVNEDGSMTITPWDIHPSKIQYRMGAAKATHDQLEAIKEETVVEAAPSHPIPDYVGAALSPEQNKEREKEKKKKLDEGVNTPSVKSYSHPGSSEQAGWKAINKHGKTKFFRKESKAAAHKHAGIELNESEQLEEARTAGVATTSFRKGYAKATSGKPTEDDIAKARKGLAKVKADHEELKKQPGYQDGKCAKQLNRLEAAKTRHGTVLQRAGLNELEQHPALGLIAELSRKTLGNYVKRATGDKENLDRDAKESSHLGHAMKKDGNSQGAHKMFMRAGNLTHKSGMRGRGIHKAVDNLMKD